MRTASTILFLLVTISLSAQTEIVRKKEYNLDRNLAIEGYDPVSYFNGKPLEGKRDYKFTYEGVEYRFASQQNLDKFKKEPAKYEPAYGGWCAYAMGAKGEKVSVDPETFKIIEGKLYLFYNSWGNNTKTDWNKEEQRLKSTADNNWQKFIQ